MLDSKAPPSGAVRTRPAPARADVHGAVAPQGASRAAAASDLGSTAEPAALDAGAIAAELLSGLLANGDFDASSQQALDALQALCPGMSIGWVEVAVTAEGVSAAVALGERNCEHGPLAELPWQSAGQLHRAIMQMAGTLPTTTPPTTTQSTAAAPTDGRSVQANAVLVLPLLHPPAPDTLHGPRQDSAAQGSPGATGSAAQPAGMLLLAGAAPIAANDLRRRLQPLLAACAAMLLWRRQQRAWAHSERGLEDERARLRSVIDSLPDPVTIKNRAGLYVDCNEVFAEYLGRTRLEVIGRTTWELFPEQVAERFERDDREVFVRGTPISRMHWHQRADTGERALVQIHKRPLRGRDGTTTGVIMAAHDVTELYLTSEREQLSAQVFATSSEGLAITDGAGVVVAVNPALLGMTGRREPELLGRAWTELDLELGEGAGSTLLPPEGMRGEGWLRDSDGVRRPVWRSIAAVREHGGDARSYVLAYLNIAELVDAREHLDHIAHHDALTGLPNRMFLQKELARTIATARAAPAGFALLFVDIDSFKTVNDSLGHSLGDKLLQGVAERLRRVLRDSDRVARIGGDEFVLLLPGNHGAAGAERVAAKVMAAFVEPFDIGGTVLFQTPSIGISLYPDDGSDAETLIRNADAAMYAAKAAGRNCFRFYSRALTAAASERLTFETAMRRALAAEEFELYYQPIHAAPVDPSSNTVAAAEVLLRWTSAELGEVAPDRFIPLAESSGMIVQIGDWVLERAMAQLCAWRAQGLLLPRLAVNVSLRQLERPDFGLRVAQMLARHGLDSSSLELEITETAVMQQEGQGDAIAQLQHLRDLGVQLAIDDFGTGYSSMSRLHATPVDRIKIDRSFFAARTGSEAAGPITRAIAAIAQELGLKLTAEGVETPELLRRAQLLGCDEMQGFHLGRPMPAARFQRALRRA